MAYVDCEVSVGFALSRFSTFDSCIGRSFFTYVFIIPARAAKLVQVFCLIIGHGGFDSHMRRKPNFPNYGR